MKLWNKLTVVSVLGLVLAMSGCNASHQTSKVNSAHPSMNPCLPNTYGDQNVKAVCLIQNDDQEVIGFMLFNANKTKSYLVVVSDIATQIRTGLGPDVIDTDYPVARADKNLNRMDHEFTTWDTISVITDKSNPHHFGLAGWTPGRRLIQTHDKNDIFAEDNDGETAYSDFTYEYTPADDHGATVMDGVSL